LINGKNGQGTQSTKMGVDKSAKNTPNAQFVCPSRNIWDFNEKDFIGRP